MGLTFLPRLEKKNRALFQDHLFSYLLRELSLPLHSPMKLFCDNILALHMAANLIFHTWTCHVEIDCDFIRELLAHGTLRSHYAHLDQQLADIFTKGLTRERFIFL